MKDVNRVSGLIKSWIRWRRKLLNLQQHLDINGIYELVHFLPAGWIKGTTIAVDYPGSQAENTSSTCGTGCSPYWLASSLGGHYSQRLVTRWSRSARPHRAASLASSERTDGPARRRPISHGETIQRVADHMQQSKAVTKEESERGRYY